MAGSLMVTWREWQVFKTDVIHLSKNWLECAFKSTLLNEILDLEMH